MNAEAAELLLDAAHAERDLGPGVGVAELGQRVVVTRMGTNSDERILGEGADLVPAHDHVGAKVRGIVAGVTGDPRNAGAQLALGQAREASNRSR